MADFHFHGKVISRGAGRSAVGAAAYRSGEKLTNEKDGITHDYTKKSGVVHTEPIMLCENAPKEYQDRATLWNAVEDKATSKERIARDFDIALPVELNREEQIQLVRNYVNDNFVKAGMCADFAIHDKEDGNPHAHIMLTMRPIDENGKWEYVSQKVYICKDHNGTTAELSAAELKKENERGGTFEKQLPYFKNGKGKATYLTKHESENDPKYKDYIRVKGKNDPLKTKEDRKNPTIEKWDSNESFNKWRENWAAYQNREFEKKNLSVRVDHRSYEAQGIDKIPTKHLGNSSKAFERKGVASDNGNINREIKRLNERLTANRIMQSQTQKEISVIRDNIASPDRKEAIKISDNLYAAYLKEYPKINAQALKKVMQETAEKGNVYLLVRVDGQLRETTITVEKYRQAEREATRVEQQKTETRPKPAEPSRPQPQGGFAARRETMKQQETPQERPQIDVAYADKMAQQLAALRNEFVRERVAAKHDRSAGSRAEEVKQVFLDTVEKIPADHRQEALERMGKYQENPEAGRTTGRIELFKAHAEARNQLDIALKEQDKSHERSKEIERER